jgi:DNA-directed RNA polymerase specialized sigma24 family protein
VEDFSQTDANEVADDPALIAAEKESINRLHLTLSGLDNDSGRLWQLLAEGTSLRQIAATLDMSYDCVKRRRRKLIEQLKNQLNEATTGLA